MADALKKGQVNLASFSDVSAADAIKNQYVPFYVNDPTVFGIFINFNHAGPLQNLKVRQAVYRAVDIQSFIKAVGGGDGTPASQVVVKDIPGFNSAIQRPSYDVAAAKKLLADAGYPNGVSFTLSYTDGISVLQSVADELKKELALAGITVNFDKVPNSDKTKFYDGRIETFYSGYSSDLLDLSDAIATEFQGKNYDNPAVDTLMESASSTFDPAKRLTILQQVSQKLMDDMAFIPMYNGVAPYLLDKTSYVIPVDVPATAYPGVYFWQVYQK